MKNSTISSGNIAAAADAAVVEPKKKQKTLKSMWKSSEEEEAVKVTETIATTSSQPLLNLLSVEYDMGGNDKRFAGEGRTITMEFDKFILVACYVPNSGEGLVRLDYRVDEW